MKKIMQLLSADGHRSEPNQLITINPDIFLTYLIDAGFLNFCKNVGDRTRAKEFKEYRAAALREIMTTLLKRASDELNLYDVYHDTYIEMVGQQHDNPFDYAMAIDSAELLGGEGHLIVERDGVIHPVLERELQNPEMQEVAGNFGCAVISEDYLCNSFLGLNSIERSYLIGTFLALVVCTDPGKPITVIFGEAHQQDIIRAMEVALDFLGIDRQLISVNYLPSFESETHTLINFLREKFADRDYSKILLLVKRIELYIADMPVSFQALTGAVIEQFNNEFDSNMLHLQDIELFIMEIANCLVSEQNNLRKTEYTFPRT